MIYAADLTIPPNTPESAPVSVTIPVHPGVLKQVEVYFPRGCAGLARVRIYYWGHPLYPSNPDAWFRGDDVLISFPEELELPGAPWEFQAVGWNEDDTYPHTPIVRLSVVPFERDLTTLMGGFLLGARAPVAPPEGI